MSECWRSSGGTYIDEILLIKEGGGQNIPSYQKMPGNVERFIKNFEPVINKLENKSEVYTYFQAELLRFALECNGSSEDIKREKMKLEKYRALSKKEAFRCDHSRLFRFMLGTKRKLKNSRLIRNIWAEMSHDSFPEYKRYI